MSDGAPFGNYFLQRRLGAGGMAEVFLAKRTGPSGFEKRLVIKRILPHLGSSSEFVDMFLREARIAARLEHPNLVHVSDFGEVNGSYYLAMEYVDGLTVAGLIGRVGTLAPGPACRIAIDVLEALHVVHSARDGDRPLGLVHRDVSSSNVMVSREGAVKLLDFGLTTPSADAGSTRIGTRHYMSPEQARGESLDARSDLYSVGVLLVRMLTGEHPEPGAERPAEIPEALWAIIESTLAEAPAARPASARDLAHGLEEELAAIGEAAGMRARLADLVVALRQPGGTGRWFERATGKLTEALSGRSGDSAWRPSRRGPAIAAVIFALGVAISVAIWSWPVAETPVERAPIAEAPPLEQPVPEPAAEPTVEPKKKRSPAAKARKGLLTIDTRPWTEVYLRGRRLGMTPLENIEVPAGTHTLELRNSKLDIRRTTQIQVRPGKTTRVNLSL